MSELIGLGDLLAAECRGKGRLKEDTSVSDFENGVAGDAICRNLTNKGILGFGNAGFEVPMTYPKECS